MRLPHSLLIVATLALTSLSAAGCAAPTAEDDVGTQGDALSTANNEFSSILAEAEKLESRCQSENKCSGYVDETGGSIRPANVGPLAGRNKNTRRATSFTMCEALSPFRGLENPYFFAGASYKAAYIATLTDGGADLVFDLKHRQAAFYHYHNEGFQNQIGGEVNVYAGWAFGRKQNVIDAWSGEFETAEATVELPILNLSAGGSIFRSPDNSLWGGALTVGLGFNLLATPVEVSVSEGHWTAWDNATKWYGNKLWFVRYDQGSAPHHGKEHTYLQFRGTRDLVLALLQTFGLAGVPAATYAAGLAALDKAGLTLDKACPLGDEPAHAPAH